ncbi:RHS repeat domain-containing protein [Riemerella anatipestifer]|uniref:RHS repeat domain-containing protein n=1 Tax=Riemerella anatipestifer TaxID=34085 RepID=UPI0023635AFD|nr:RHS repeat-associated core domain-containing protein [Riemerella anatipestifer]MDD1524988.1 hypothetical protein [Riemerella anatipestifer]
MYCQTVIKSKDKFRGFVGPTTETRRSDDGAVRNKKRLPKWQKGKFTKHYFEGTSRIVSKLGEGTFHQPIGLTAGGIDYIKQSAKIQEAIDQYIKGLNIPPGPPTQHGIYGTPDFTGQEYPSIDWSDISQDQEPPEGWPRPPKFNEPGDVPGPPVQYGDPVKPDNVKGGFGYVDNGIEEKNLYFYHPDHLGSSSYITDKDGNISQHTEYIAFGEVLFDEHKVSRRMPYLFNGKELDSETGLYYYGARYYDPKTSIWLNVDPLVEKTMQPYVFSNNNPVNFVDLDGKEPFDWIRQMVNGKSIWTYNANIKTVTQASLAGYQNVVGVYSSATISREGTMGLSSYSFSLNSNGSVTNNSDGSFVNNTFTTNGGSTINAPSGTFMSEAKMDFWESWSNSDNFIAKFTYDIANSAYLTAQVFDGSLMERPEWQNPFGGNFGNLDGTPNYKPTDGFVNTVGTILPFARGTSAAKSVMPVGLTFSKLNAAQFSSTFKGTLSKAKPAIRGVLNRYLNKGINFINGQIENGMKAQTAAKSTGNLLKSKENE